jgi:hypothetical protein
MTTHHRSTLVPVSTYSSLLPWYCILLYCSGTTSTRTAPGNVQTKRTTKFYYSYYIAPVVSTVHSLLQVVLQVPRETRK